VVFVHGCFWHGHKACRKGSLPTSNSEFWTEKISKNVERDRAAHQRLRRDGWRVLTIWECETRDTDKLVFRLDSFMKS
jgi:DNA mismatch endonuclease (patch repair protein)